MSVAVGGAEEVLGGGVRGDGVPRAGVWGDRMPGAGVWGDRVPGAGVYGVRVNCLPVVAPQDVRVW